MYYKNLSPHPGLKVKRKLSVLFIVFICLGLKMEKLIAQPASKSPLYEQASEVSGLIVQYGQDINAVRDFYSPYTAIDG